MMGLNGQVKNTLKMIFTQQRWTGLFNTMRYVMTTGHRKLLRPLPPSPQMQIPGQALFIPHECVKMFGVDETEFVGFFTDRRDLTGHETSTENRFEMKARLRLFPRVEGSGSDEIGQFRWVPNQRTFLRESIRFTKVYDTHEVRYRGKLRGAVIQGVWQLDMADDLGGQFCLWPKDFHKFLDVEMCKAANLDMTKYDSLRNQGQFSIIGRICKIVILA